MLVRGYPIDSLSCFLNIIYSIQRNLSYTTISYNMDPFIINHSRDKITLSNAYQQI